MDILKKFVNGSILLLEHCRYFRTREPDPVLAVKLANHILLLDVPEIAPINTIVPEELNDWINLRFRNHVEKLVFCHWVDVSCLLRMFL